LCLNPILSAGLNVNLNKDMYMSRIIIAVVSMSFLFLGCDSGKKTATTTAKTTTAATCDKAKPAKKDPAKPAKKDDAKPAAKVAAAPAAKANSCGEALDAYGKFVDEYVAALQAAAKSNPATAMMKVAPLMQKAQAAANKLDKATLKGDCLKSYSALMMKMSKAATSLAAAAGAPKAVAPAAAADAMKKASGAAACMQKCMGVADAAKKAQCLMGCNK
jgi:Meckel syndrome type 1 protein